MSEDKLSKEETQKFGLPIIHFTGWFDTLVTTDVAGHLILYDIFPERQESAARVAFMLSRNSDPQLNRIRIGTALMSLADLLLNGKEEKSNE